MVLEVVRAASSKVRRNAGRLPPPIRRVHATTSKRTRAQSVAAFYEVGRIRHATDGTGRLTTVEDQMLTWTGIGDSPDRIDALFHGLTALFLPHHSDASIPPAASPGGRWAQMRER